VLIGSFISMSVFIFISGQSGSCPARRRFFKVGWSYGCLAYRHRTGFIHASREESALGVIPDSLRILAFVERRGGFHAPHIPHGFRFHGATIQFESSRSIKRAIWDPFMARLPSENTFRPP